MSVTVQQGQVWEWNDVNRLNWGRFMIQEPIDKNTVYVAYLDFGISGPQKSIGRHSVAFILSDGRLVPYEGHIWEDRDGVEYLMLCCSPEMVTLKDVETHERLKRTPDEIRATMTWKGHDLSVCRRLPGVNPEEDPAKFWVGP